jgi:peroxin-1
MLGQKDEGQDGPITLTAVETRVVRTGKKWRYPTNLFVDATKVFGMPATTHEDFILEGEPVEDGSFVCSLGPTCNSFHRVVLRSDSCGASGDNNAAAIHDKCFIFREDLPRYVTTDVACGVGDPESQDSGNGSQLAALPFEVLQSPQLLNLLPENYVFPSILHGDSEWRSFGGDTLIHGDLGSGKTQTALLMAAIDRFQRDATTFYLDCKKLKEARGIRMKDILEEINRVFDDASALTVDSTIILDDLDSLAPDLEQGNDVGSAHSHQVNHVAVDQAKLLADTLRRHIVQKPRRMPSFRRVSLIITCRHSRSLLQAIVSARPFTCRITAPNLTPLEKEKILWRTISSRSRVSGDSGEATLKSRRIGRKCEGYGPQDLMLLASRVKHSLRTGGREFSATAAAEIIEDVLTVFTARHKLSLNDDACGAAEWDDIGGLFEVKEALASTILSPAKYRRIYAKAKIQLPRGILLFGCPGCGKSYLVPAVARKCGFSLITCRGPEILDRYIGASELKVRELFARAAASAPAILFFDEIDSLAPRRGSDKTGVTDRVVNQLLTLLDGVEEIGGAGMVYILAATSRPDIIDPALLRPGRLEKHVYVGYPSSEDETTEILMKISARYLLDDVLHQSISSGNLVRELKNSSFTFDRLSAADLKAAFDTAQLDAIHEILQAGFTNDTVVIGCQHLLKALRSTRPSLPERDHGMLMAAYRPFRNGLLTADSPNVISELRTSLR